MGRTLPYRSLEVKEGGKKALMSEKLPEPGKTGEQRPQTLVKDNSRTLDLDKVGIPGRAAGQSLVLSGKRQK